MLIPRSQPVAGLDVDNGLRSIPGLAADHVLAVDILHRVVVVGGPEAVELALVLAVHGQSLQLASATFIVFVVETGQLGRHTWKMACPSTERAAARRDASESFMVALGRRQVARETWLR